MKWKCEKTKVWSPGGRLNSKLVSKLDLSLQWYNNKNFKKPAHVELNIPQMRVGGNGIGGGKRRRGTSTEKEECGSGDGGGEGRRGGLRRRRRNQEEGESRIRSLVERVIDG